MSAVVCSLSALPFLALPFLPCELLSYRASVIVIQLLGSCRVAGNLSGYMTYGLVSHPVYSIIIVMLLSHRVCKELCKRKPFRNSSHIHTYIANIQLFILPEKKHNSIK